MLRQATVGWTGRDLTEMPQGFKSLEEVNWKSVTYGYNGFILSVL